MAVEWACGQNHWPLDTSSPPLDGGGSDDADAGINTSVLADDDDVASSDQETATAYFDDQ